MEGNAVLLGPLFDMCAGRHRGNRESREAFARISERRSAQRERVYAWVQRSGPDGITCRELASAWGCGMNQISGRFSELKASGRIRKVGVREGCGVCVAD